MEGLHQLKKTLVAGVSCWRKPCRDGLLLVVSPGLVSCTFFLTAKGLYSSSDDVIELTPSNFNQEVIQSDSLWLVEFFAPW